MQGMEYVTATETEEVINESKSSARIPDHDKVLGRFVLDICSSRKVETLAEGHNGKFSISAEYDLQNLQPGRKSLTEHIKPACSQAGYL